MEKIEILGWIGFAILVSAWIPQTLETIREGRTSTNLAFIIMYVVASLLLTVYSILIEDYVFIALNGLITIGSGINLYYKLFPKNELQRMKTIVLASRNPDKIKELREVLSGLKIDLKSALDFPDLAEVEEDKLTLEGNALKKAWYVYEQTGLPALGDDTGLEVKALEGRPGVLSARYSGENATYQENLDKLLKEMAKVKPKDRLAHFRTVVAFIDMNGDEHTFEGICRGTILNEPRGDSGFGYDPVFQPDGFDKSFAELDPDKKNRISHRGRAIREFYKWLRSV